MKTKRQVIPMVTVQKWEHSHYTGNGNGVYSFIIQTPAGEIIEGKTQPGLHQHIGRSVDKLVDVQIDTTATGRIIMKDANRA